MPNFELKFTATPELDPQADAKLQKQWDRLQKSIKETIEIRPEVNIPAQTFTKVRHRYIQMMNDLGKNPVEVKLDLKKLEAQIGESKFKKLGLGEQYAIDFAKYHRTEVRNLESEYVNLKVKMREAAETLSGDMKAEAIKNLEQQVVDLGEKIKATFASDEVEHFNRTMGELGGKGSAQVVGIQEFANSISGVRERIVELSGEGERLVRVTQVFEDGEWKDATVQIQDRTAKLTQEYKKLNKQMELFNSKFKVSEDKGEFGSRWQELNKQVEEFNVNAPDARERFEEISLAFTKLQGEVSGASGTLASFKRTLNEYVDLQVKLRDVQLKNGFAEDETTKSLRTQIAVVQQKLAQQRKELNSTNLGTQAKNADIDANNKLNKSLKELTKNYQKESDFISNVIHGFQDAAARIIDYTTVYRLMWAAVSKLRQSIDVAKELNSVFTDIEMVTMGTAEATEKLRKEYADLAVEMSATVTDVGKGKNLLF